MCSPIFHSGLGRSIPKTAIGKCWFRVGLAQPTLICTLPALASGKLLLLKEKNLKLSTNPEIILHGVLTLKFISLYRGPTCTNHATAVRWLVSVVGWVAIVQALVKLCVYSANHCIMVDATPILQKHPELFPRFLRVFFSVCLILSFYPSIAR